MLKALSLAVVGAGHPNKRGPARRYGIALCAPGDPIELRREPKNEYDENAIAVFGHDTQLGYVRSERAALLAPMIDRGRELCAIFQEGTNYGAVIRVAFDGETPTLPEPGGGDPTSDDSRDGFYPDDIYPDE